MILSGKKLAIATKERQKRAVADLGRAPRLVIVRDSDEAVIAKYVGLKRAYGAEIGVEVVDRLVGSEELSGVIRDVAADAGVDGVIIQLPLEDASRTDEMIGLMNPEQDVDGLTGRGEFASATAAAIDLLLNGTGVELAGKKIAVVGYGRLVGAPLAAMWRARGLEVEVFRSGADLGQLRQYDGVVTAVGKPGLIESRMIKPGAVVVDAGTATDGGTIHGDVEDALRQREDIAITPVYGGVGPLTVCGLFENVIRAAGRGRGE
jgi:methylenetetrahydrofolate dehydrogenase (NADP+)/methenyltetrahydrofolate cyclohydrolase